ncbi:YetF domain-containing protein [Deinococcus pimensis]|uniref:YetF domain-containing protein n=1 Tax=Deinococcus pimensis TaxID=309888 RepID=UPI0004B9BA00|nr:YetF domain-containing protein [Deinococcus pimensis]
MDPQDVVPFDLHRMFLGDFPPLFLLEIVFRTVFLYVWLLLLLRVVGRRGLAQLSIVEFGIVIALGSAAGDGLFYPEVPLVHAMLVILLVILMQKGLTVLINRSETVETFVEGRPVCVVEDGRVRLEGLPSIGLSTEELFERLRERDVAQLGQVRYAFQEQSGNLSVFLFPDADVRPGLPLVPPDDLRTPTKVPFSADPTAMIACTNCGNVVPQGDRPFPCPRCGRVRWVRATLQTDVAR